MPIFNDIDLKKWKESEILTDSLWIINDRDNSGKHDGFYHGNFIPQIPRQLILRYSKKNEIVFDPFVGSGTTAIECENLNRNFIGIDIQNNLIEKIEKKIDVKNTFQKFITGDSTNPDTFQKVKNILNSYNKEYIQLAILHPPYFDIIKFSNFKEDLSNSNSLSDFLEKFRMVLLNTLKILQKNRYLIIVIGDKYSSGEWIPLSFYCLGEAKKLGLTLKSIVIKNMTGNRGKSNKQAIWRYRALSSDYFIFKHEYILIFKN